MGSLKLIITADYEVFGNGSGDIQSCVFIPSEKIMSLCEEYGANVTFFFDVCEYWAFKEVFENDKLKFNSRPPHLIFEDQMKDAVTRGHDVQLHFHPQWLDYKLKNDSWHLNYDYWRLPEVKNLKDWNINKLFSEGKETLNNMLKAVNTDYNCHIFRAGAWCIQPEKEILEAMKKQGIDIDSTVAPGMSYNDGRTIYDFSKARSDSSWKVDKNLLIHDSEGQIMELPIFTTYVSSLNSVIHNLYKIVKQIPGKPEGCLGSKDAYYQKKITEKIKNVFQPKVRMLNFSDGISFQEMKYITNKAIHRYRKLLLEKDVPIVMIGHPKTFGNHNEFSKYLKWVSNHKEIEFGTYENFSI